MYGLCRLVNNYPDAYFRPRVGPTRERMEPGLRPTLSILYTPAAQDSDIAAAAYQMSVEHAVGTLKSSPKRQISTAAANRPHPRTGTKRSVLQRSRTASPEHIGVVRAEALLRSPRSDRGSDSTRENRATQAPRKYDQETRDRAVWMYRERRQAHPAESANESRRQIGGLIDVNPEALRSYAVGPTPTLDGASATDKIRR